MLHSLARSLTPRRPDLTIYPPPDTCRCHHPLSRSPSSLIPPLLRQFPPGLRAGRREFRYQTSVEFLMTWRFWFEMEAIHKF
ncbi:hypothetical protein VNO77_20950 [Canavalia gladiata]|uniref:Uncharacterized protein n=1 Tax=Canavalia gladiata TaxID=3824 RepID=A0AAN9QMY1_CANGL